MIRRWTFRVMIVVAAMMAPILLVPFAVAGTASVTVTSSRGILPFGQTVDVSGSVTGDQPCEAGRTARLQWSAAGTATTFSTITETTTAGDGSFTFEDRPAATGRYRAMLPADGACAEITSNEAVVRVRVVVDASVVTASGDVGSCIDVTAIVSPAKPGQTVDLEKRVGGHWQLVETLPLNGDSEARAHPCLGWDDLGVARYQVRWSPQDPLNETGTSPELAVAVTEAPWMGRIDDLVGRRPVSIAVGEADSFLYRHLDQADRTPASNEKLLLAMTLLDHFGPDHRIPTMAMAENVNGRVVRGDLWLVGRGDPIVTPSSLAPLADQLVAAGIDRVTGQVLGSTTYFSRDWDAPGWNSVATDYVNRPTALTFRGNHDPDPEREAATALTKLLTTRGVQVRGRPGAGAAPGGLDTIATIESKPLTVLLAKMLRPSWNFAAEILGKGLGADVRGTPGTIAKGAATIQAWVRDHGADFSLHDNSGLSYANHVDAADIVRLLWTAEASDWGDELRQALPTGGQGTLDDRLHSVKIRAKTGTLTDISALSGWVWADRLQTWIEFSILSDVAKPAAADIEDRIVRLLQNYVG